MKEEIVVCPDCGKTTKILHQKITNAPPQPVFTCLHCGINVYGAENIDRWFKSRLAVTR